MLTLRRLWCRLAGHRIWSAPHLRSTYCPRCQTFWLRDLPMGRTGYTVEWATDGRGNVVGMPRVRLGHDR